MSILCVTLFPFKFRVDHFQHLDFWVRRFLKPTVDFDDLLANIVLFIPFGFGCTLVAVPKPGQLLRPLLVVLLWSLLLSSGVEFLQLFLTARNCSIVDILTNTIGGCLGFLLYHWCRLPWFFKVVNQAKTFLKRLRRRDLVRGAIGYFVLLASISLFLQAAVNFSNWDVNFPLFIGNEKGGDRPWQGIIAEVHVASRAASEQEIAELFANRPVDAVLADDLLASYQFTPSSFPKGEYPDQSGHSPPLIWQRAHPDRLSDTLPAQPEVGVRLSSEYWLTAVTPPILLTQKIKKSEQFTVILDCATADLTQTGPGRIVSLSSSIFHRNLTLGQQKDRLSVRLRTPISGAGSVHPELIFPNIFTDTNRHRLIIRYQHSVLTLYVDSPHQIDSLAIAPEVTIYRYLIPVGLRSIPLQPASQLLFKLPYYGLLFVPLGWALAALLPPRRKWLKWHGLFLGIGILLPGILLEGLLAGVAQREMSWINLLLSGGLSTIALGLSRLNARSLPNRF